MVVTHDHKSPAYFLEHPSKKYPQIRKTFPGQHQIDVTSLFPDQARSPWRTLRFPGRCRPVMCLSQSLRHCSSPSNAVIITNQQPRRTSSFHIVRLPPLPSQSLFHVCTRLCRSPHRSLPSRALAPRSHVLRADQPRTHGQLVRVVTYSGRRLAPSVARCLLRPPAPEAA